MSRSEIEDMVAAERESLLDGEDGLEDAVVTVARRAQPVALGLLALGEVAAAKN